MKSESGGGLPVKHQDIKDFDGVRYGRDDVPPDEDLGIASPTGELSSSIPWRPWLGLSADLIEAPFIFTRSHATRINLDGRPILYTSMTSKLLTGYRHR